MDVTRLLDLLGKLTGEPVPSPDRLKDNDGLKDESINEVGYSQLNELLLLAGLDRVNKPFFAYLVSGTTDFDVAMAFESLAQLEGSINRFRKIALLTYGNVKFAFKRWSKDPSLLGDVLEGVAPVDASEFEARHDPIFPVVQIAPAEAYLTGYVIEEELKRTLAANPLDARATELETKRQEIVSRAIRNQNAYYASDHMDVYVATSMRARHEFISISRTVADIFAHNLVAHLKLRWFDPTQAYCVNRIDKGLAEALMLKRAKCTIYLAQESDTLGKDSELASTLAQGKPVIAFVPDVDEEYFEFHLRALQDAEPATPLRNHLLEQLKLLEPEAAWTDSTVQEWCRHPEDVPIELLRSRVRLQLKKRYDSRAKTLREVHPLGIQVNLQSGVANGVLVVRSVPQCAELVRRIVTGSLEFEVEDVPEATVLREAVSQSVFRVMTHDELLTNTFWNFYLNSAEY